MKRRLARTLAVLMVAAGAAWWLWPTGPRPWRTIEWEDWQTSIQFTPDGRTLVAGGRSVTVVPIARDGPQSPGRVLPGSDQGPRLAPETDHWQGYVASIAVVRQVQISPDGSTVVAGDGRSLVDADEPMMIRAWDAGSGECRATLPVTQDEFRWPSLRADLGFADQGGEIRAARLMSGGPLVVSRWESSSGHPMPPLLVANGGTEPNLWVDDGNVLIYLNDQRTRLLLRDVRTDRYRATFPAVHPNGDPDRFVGVSASRDGWVVATTTTDGAAQFWDARRNRLVAEVDAGPVGLWDGETRIEVDPTGRAVTVLTPHQPLRLWDVAAAGFAATIPVERDQGEPLIAFSPDGGRLAVADSPPREPGPWDRFQVLAAPHLRPIGLGSLVPGPAACPPDPRRIRVYDVRTGQRLAQFDRGPDTLLGLVFSPDGRVLATHGNRPRGTSPASVPENVTMLWDVPDAP